MPPSQLKQLKASLRDGGLLGPQQSKKQKQQNAKSGVAAQNRIQRNNALQAIRDRFNPFEIKTTSRPKFDVTTRDVPKKNAGQARPGVTKSYGEEKVVPAQYLQNFEIVANCRLLPFYLEASNPSSGDEPAKQSWRYSRSSFW